MDIYIREATKRDLSGILSLYSQPDLDDGQVLTTEHAEHVFEEMRRYPNYRVYVASHGSLVVGTFALLIMDNLIHHGKPSGILEAVAVDPEFQRRGVGRQMIHFAMDRCREFGCYKISLSSNFRLSKAHEFYDSLGFRRHGISFVVDLVAEGGAIASTMDTSRPSNPN
ncbi:MAG: GNAT family N-acetyltransferase [Synechococcales bacterium]|nr:GNAT family N-acetyltransferase [Synechococcales bacterium]